MSDPLVLSAGSAPGAAFRVPPARANAAGWWLFIFLAALAAGIVLAAMNAAKFATAMFMAPIGLVALAAAVLTVVSARR